MPLRHGSLRECPEQIHRFFLHFCRIIHQRCASHLYLWDSLLKCFPRLFLQVFGFFVVFFFLEFCSSHEEKVSWRSWHHAVLKIFLFPEGSATETTNSDCGEEEGEQWICSYTLLSHCSALLSSCCDIFVPRTPQVCIVFLCSLILPYPPFATLSH